MQPARLANGLIFKHIQGFIIDAEIVQNLHDDRAETALREGRRPFHEEQNVV